MISIIIPVLNGSSFIRKCLDAIFSSDYSDFECIIVDDGSKDGTRDIVGEYKVRLEQLLDGPHGPAYARNRGAELAAGDILFFVDADVVIKPDTLSKIANVFAQHPAYSAVFGSYDDAPADDGFISQYKNLFHHFVHQQASEDGGTFWSGCGAIRRDVFLALDGFDHKRFPKPSIEDIDLGVRLRKQGYKIRLEKSIQVKHLKRWTLTGLIRTDVLDRAIPWTLLILQSKKLPNDLNLKLPQRVSAGLTVLFLGLSIAVSFFQRSIQIPIILALFFLITSNWYVQGNNQFFKMEWKAEILLYILTGIGIVTSFIDGNSIQTILLSILLLLAFFSLHLIRSSIWARNIVFAGVISILFVVYVSSVETSPALLKISSYLVVLSIVALNLSLYRFLLDQRGLFFSIAVFPFHLLYFLYSLVAFIIAGGMHFLKAARI